MDLSQAENAAEVSAHKLEQWHKMADAYDRKREKIRSWLSEYLKVNFPSKLEFMVQSGYLRPVYINEPGVDTGEYNEKVKEFQRLTLDSGRLWDKIAHAEQVNKVLQGAGRIAAVENKKRAAQGKPPLRRKVEDDCGVITDKDLPNPAVDEVWDAMIADPASVLGNRWR